ncbi:MAG: hypothetical protein ACXVHQ_36965 [Solirubrobacteraceae bacterium]
MITVLGTLSSAFEPALAAPDGGDVVEQGLCCVLVGERLAVYEERL